MNLPPHLQKNPNFNYANNPYASNIQNMINQNLQINSSSGLAPGLSGYNVQSKRLEDTNSLKKEKKRARVHLKEKKKLKNLRKAGGEMWCDPTLEEWPENDFRMFCGDLGNEVTDEILANAFRKYPSFQKARVLRDKRTGKTKGYGFISFKESEDYIKAMREMNGKYVGNRPIRLKRSTWKDRNIGNSKSKLEHVKFKKNKQKIRKNLINNNMNGMNNGAATMFNNGQNFQQGGQTYTYYKR